MSTLSIITYSIEDFIKNPDVLNLYRDPFDYTKTLPKNWLKILQDNPRGSQKDLALILTIDDDKIVGQLGLFASVVFSNRVDIPIYCISTFFLADEYKKSGAGGLMLLRAIRFSKNLLASGAPRIDTQKLYIGTGFKELGPLQRFVYFYNFEVIAKKYFKNRFLSSILGKIGNPLLKGYYKIKSEKRESNIDYKKVNQFSHNLDELGKQLKLNHFPKSSKILNWVVNTNKNVLPFEIYKNNKLAGYCLLCTTHRPRGGSHSLPEMKTGVLLDYYLNDCSLEIKRDLVLFGLNYFKINNIDLFEFQHFDKDYSKICSNLGMVRLGGNKVFLRLAKTDNFDANDEWFLTHGTGDVIFTGY
jgi:hypothetical protein